MRQGCLSPCTREQATAKNARSTAFGEQCGAGLRAQEEESVRAAAPLCSELQDKSIFFGLIYICHDRFACKKCID